MSKITPIERSGTRAIFMSAGFKGGEGTLLLNVAPHGYWKETLFARAGRPLPPWIFTFVYVLYVATVTVVSEVVLTSSQSIAVDGITTSSVGGCLFFLLVFRSSAA